jgi:sugar transferase (PEP-CTERM/EpsH1 system associated)
MPLRIMHVVDNVGRGGMQNGLLNLVDHLDPTRFQHVICAMRPVDPVDAYDFTRDWVRVTCLPRRKGSRIQIGDLVRAIREVKPEIIHSRNWSGIEGVIAGYWGGSCSLVHSEHGLDTSPDTKEPGRRVAFRRLSYELADRVFCVSHQLKDLFVGRTGFAPRKMDVIYNGVDTRRFAPDPATRARLRRELDLSDSDFLIGCVGNLTPVKDHKTLLEALCGFVPEHRHWRLIILGEGPERTRLESFLEFYPDWRHRVLFPGRSNNVAGMLNAMDVYVLPSLAEGISNSLLEAMATALPAVVTRTGGNPEVLVDGHSGLLFPARDAQKLADLLRLLEQEPHLRMELGRQALSRVRTNFSIGSMVSRYEQLYQQVAGKAAASALTAVGV